MQPFSANKLYIFFPLSEELIIFSKIHLYFAVFFNNFVFIVKSLHV
jgi:hypothetical protein